MTAIIHKIRMKISPIPFLVIVLTGITLPLCFSTDPRAIGVYRLGISLSALKINFPPLQNRLNVGTTPALPLHQRKIHPPADTC